MNYLLVFIGAGIGGVLRQGVNVATMKWFGLNFPWGTLTVNILGSLIMGLIAEYWAVKSGLPQSARLFLTTGVLGGFTTFSTFSLDTATIFERGETWLATGYAIASVVLSVGSLFLGLAIVRNFVGAQG